MPGVNFFRRGWTQVWFLPTVADISAPDLSAEISTGTDLSDLADISGFSFSSTQIETPNLISSYVGKIPGPDSADDSSITFYENRPYSLANNPHRTTLAKGTTGFILIAPGGGSGTTGADGRKALAATDIVDVWPIIVAGVSRNISTSNDPATWVANMSTNSAPAVDVAIVA